MTIALGLLAAAPVTAHELAETSATLIVRDGGHVELRLHIPWSDVLRSRWMPGVPMEEFLVRVTSQPEADFKRDLLRVEADVERDARVVGDGGAPSPLGRWQWPASSAVQGALKRELMSRLVDRDRFEHASRLPVSAEVTLARGPATVSLRLPGVLGPALLTVYRPAEQWLSPGQWSTPVPVAAPVPASH
jgi:hypothetical protein